MAEKNSQLRGAENIEKPPENKTLISGPKTFPFPTRFLVVVGSGTLKT